MSPTTSADLVFVNGAVYTVDAARSWAQAVAVQDGRIATVGTDDDVRHGRSARAPRSSIWPGACSCPGSRTPTSIRSSGGLDMLQCDLHDLSTAGGLPRSRSRPTPTTTPSVPWILGGGWSMDAFPGGTPTKDRARRDRARPARLPAQPRRSRRVGQLACARARRRHAGTRPIPPTAGSSATPTASRRGRCTRVRPIWSSGPCAGAHRGRTAPRAFARVRRTCIRSASRPGRTPSSATISSVDNFDDVRRRRRAPASSPPGSWARCGGTATGASSRSTTWSRYASAARVGRFAATSVKIMQDGVCENFTAAVLEPYLDAHGQPSDEPRHLVRRARRC